MNDDIEECKSLHSDAGAGTNRFSASTHDSRKGGVLAVLTGDA